MRTRLYTRQRFFKLLLAKLRQKEKLKLKHSKIKWFWRFSIASPAQK
jgi:hypothetical protein